MNVAETHRRLRAVKKSLMNKNQALLYDAEINCLDIELCDEDEFYLAPIKFDDQKFFSYLLNNAELFNKSNFVHQDLFEYVNDRKKDLCRSFATTAMLFTKYRKQSIINKHVIVNVGSIYHAPRIFYRDESSKRVVYERCSEYIDLL